MGTRSGDLVRAQRKERKGNSGLGLILEAALFPVKGGSESNFSSEGLCR